MTDANITASRDKLENAATKMDCIADLFCSTNAKDLFLTENGLSGLVNILWNIREDIQEAEQLLGKVSA